MANTPDPRENQPKVNHQDPHPTQPVNKANPNEDRANQQQADQGRNPQDPKAQRPGQQQAEQGRAGQMGGDKDKASQNAPSADRARDDKKRPDQQR